MKIKEEYILQEIAGKWLVADINTQSVNFNKILSLNNTGKFLWNKLEEGSDADTLAAALAEEFGIDIDTAKNDADKFICELVKLGCITDET